VSFGNEEKGKILGKSSPQPTPFLVKKESWMQSRKRKI
jgi:hypothetical protein